MIETYRKETIFVHKVCKRFSGSYDLKKHERTHTRHLQAHYVIVARASINKVKYRIRTGDFKKQQRTLGYFKNH